MANSEQLKNGPVGETAIHICVDMQRMFAEGTAWQMPWLEKVLPNITAIVEAAPERTIFTRFIPAQEPGQGSGMWAKYYTRWSCMTLAELGPDMIDIVPTLVRYIPPARIFDKPVYSPWTGSDLHAQLKGAGIDTVIMSASSRPCSAPSTGASGSSW